MNHWLISIIAKIIIFAQLALKQPLLKLIKHSGKHFHILCGSFSRKMCCRRCLRTIQSLRNWKTWLFSFFTLSSRLFFKHRSLYFAEVWFIVLSHYALRYCCSASWEAEDFWKITLRFIIKQLSRILPVMSPSPHPVSHLENALWTLVSKIVPTEYIKKHLLLSWCRTWDCQCPHSLCPRLAMSVTEEQGAVPLLQWGPKVGQGAGLGHRGMRWVPWGWRPCGLSPTQGKGEEAEEILRWDPETERTRKLAPYFCEWGARGNCLVSPDPAALCSSLRRWDLLCLLSDFTLQPQQPPTSIRCQTRSSAPTPYPSGRLSACLSLTWHSCAPANPALDQLQFGFPGAGSGCPFV